MKHPALAGLAAVSIAAATLVAPTIATADSYTATIAAGHPPVFRWVRMFPEAFIPAVQKALEGTGHEITFSEQYGGAIAGVGEELEAVEAGLAELGTCQALFDPAKLGPQNVTYYTPFVSADARTVADTVDALHASEPRMLEAYAENGVVYVGAPIAIDDYLLMTNFPVASMADLDGRKIAAPGAAINWLSGTGAVGVSGNLTTYYNEIKTGVYDVVIVFASAALPGKLFEVAPHITRFGLGAQYAGSICANQDWWDGLPEEVQAAVKAGADAAKSFYMDDLEAFVAKSFTAMEGAGATIADATPEMRAKWAEGMDNAAKEWAAKLDAEGKPGSLILSSYMEAMRSAGATPLRDWDAE